MQVLHNNSRRENERSLKLALPPQYSSYVDLGLDSKQQYGILMLYSVVPSPAPIPNVDAAWLSYAQGNTFALRAIGSLFFYV